ncbi:MAG: uracil-DNA glycosylase [Geminicoccaceae bacterium]
MPQPVPSAIDLETRRGVLAWLDWYERMGVLDAVMEPGALQQAAAEAAVAAPALAEPTGAEPMLPALDLGVPLAPAPPLATSRAPARREGDRAAHARAIAAACGSLAELEAALERFEGCPLRETATRLCFADGAPTAPLMLIGEAPGAEEDRQGRPFVGPSGQLLDRMLAAIGLDRGQVWITNILFWRPPGNRTPTTIEVATCQPFLERQIELLAPRLILFLGGSAARALLDQDMGVTRLRGRSYVYRPAGLEPIPAHVTFHPAYLLRQPLQKRLVWRDLLAVRRRLDELLTGAGAAAM